MSQREEEVYAKIAAELENHKPMSMWSYDSYEQYHAAMFKWEDIVKSVALAIPEEFRENFRKIAGLDTDD